MTIKFFNQFLSLFCFFSLFSPHLILGDFNYKITNETLYDLHCGINLHLCRNHFANPAKPFSSVSDKIRGLCSRAQVWCKLYNLVEPEDGIFYKNIEINLNDWGVNDVHYIITYSRVLKKFVIAVIS